MFCNVRRKALLIGIVIAIGGLGIASFVAAQTEAPAKSAGGKRYALLVGVTKYYNVPNSDLVGPGNDVLLFRGLLTDHYQFKDMPITVLAEGQGGLETRPTRENIEREFKKLASQVQPGDDVIVLLGGHGYFLPDQNPSADDPEPDGLDEVFLPADIMPYSSAEKTIKNAIRDDDLRDWITAIRDRGAFVWVVMDSCHSGTGTRGFGEVSREANPVYLGIPSEVLSSWYKLGEKSRGGASPNRKEQLLDAPSKSGRGEWVAMYGAQSIETAPELMLPIEANENQRKWHGLLTFTIRQILTSSEEKLTYRDLMQRIQRQYASMPRPNGPIPLIEGSALDREVLGTHEWPGRSRLQVKKVADRLMLNGGTMHGLSNGTILAINKQSVGEPSGYVKIIECTATESTLVECDKDGQPPPRAGADLTVGYVTIAKIDYSFLRPLIVGMDPLDAKTKSGDVLSRIQTGLAGGGRVVDPSQAMVKLQESQDQANWVVRILDGKAYLIPSSGWTIEVARAGENPRIAVPGPEYGPFTTDEAGMNQLADNLRKIAKAQNLLRLAPAPTGSKLVSGAVNVELEVKRHSGVDDPTGIPLDLSAGLPLLKENDLIGFHVTNKGRSRVDVTLLYIDAAFGITPWFPSANEVGNRIESGDTFSPPAIKLARVTTDTTGLEHMVLVAVEGKGPPVDYTWLGQEGVARARGDSPTKDLDSLLGFATQRVGSRSAKPVESGGTAYVLRTVSWKVLPTR